jgi:hypothetical protein
LNNFTNTSDAELNALYESGERRVLNEFNRIKLPELVEALKKSGYVNLPPLHQRRVLWDSVQQSRLIESFIANIPVPPMVFYEQEHKSYEVIDGIERISTIQAFYSNQLRLSGLELWSELNRCTYAELPWKVRTALDRRSISYIVIIAPIESTSSEALYLKQLAFERLNIGRADPCY